jgi:predicted transcriptional regulator of viral defense system
MDKREGNYSETQGIQFLKEIAAHGRFVFSTDDVKDISAQICISPGYTRQIMPQLVKAGWVQRLRRGLYAWSGTLPGGTTIHPFVVATQLVQPSAISHWSAMNYHGFTEQVPQIVMVSTPKKVVTPSMRKAEELGPKIRHCWEIGGIRYEYVTVKSRYFFGIEEIWVDQTFRVPITDPERTLLDLFAQPRLFGGLGEALTVLQEHIANVNVHQLVSYAVHYGKGSVAKRLGWSLEQVGVSSDVLISLLEMPTTGYKILDPTKPHRGPCDNRWSIQNNLDSRVAL